MNADLLFEIVKPSPDWSAIVDSVITQAEWRRILVLAADHRLLPLLYWRFNGVRPDVVPAGVLSQARVAFHATVARNLQLASELANIVTWLQSEKIPVVPFKGPTLTALVYENLGLRNSDDLDLLVPPTCVPRAIEVLRANGYQAKGAEGATALAGNNEIVLFCTGRADIDLHWAVSPVYFLRFDEEGIWDRLERVKVAGHMLPTLCAEDLFLCLALHGARHCWSSLGWICDVSYLLRTLPLDWGFVHRQSERFRCRRAVSLAILLAAGISDEGIPEHQCARARGDITAMAIAEEILRALLAGRPDIAGTPHGAFMHLRIFDSPAGRVRYVWRRALLPNQTDNNAVNTPSTIHPFLYLVRPLRIATKWYRLRTGIRQSAVDSHMR